MNTVEIITLAVVLASVFVGLTGTIILVGQRPSFWIGAIISISIRIWPLAKAYITRRNPPAIEAKMHDCHRSGGEWDNFRKRCK